MNKRVAALWVGLLVSALGAHAQESEPVFTPPEDLLPFWRHFSAANDADDEDEMDKRVRQFEDLARDVLDIMLDDLSTRDNPDLHHLARTLAWSMDRVAGSTRYIERVRLVLDLDQLGRRTRQAALAAYVDGFDFRDEALTTRIPEAYEDALNSFAECEQRCRQIGDYEFAVKALFESAMLERSRDNHWESSQYLAQIPELGEKLHYTEPLVESAKIMLEALAAQGIDPDGEPPSEGAGGIVDYGDADAPVGRGGGLSSFKSGAEAHSYTLERKVMKKAPGESLPTLHPYEQHFLWPYSYVTGDGPDAFDLSHAGRFQPFGTALQLVRDGTANFGLDSDGDGRADVEFTPSSSPSTIELPDPSGGPSFPMFVCVPSDRENQFGIDVNYSPQIAGSRLRFQSALAMEGDVLDEDWTLYDTNVSGVFGDVFENVDDGITDYDPSDHVEYFETDSLVIGRSKRGIPWSSVLPIDGSFYRAALDPDGRRVELRELELETGEVELDLDLKEDPASLLVRATGDLAGAFFDIVPERRGGVELPVGTYRFAGGVITKGSKTSMDVVRIYAGTFPEFEVKAGETTELSFGGPFSLRMKARAEGDGLLLQTRTLRVFGSSGEEYAMLYDEALQPTIELRTADGRKFGKEISTRLPDVSHWQTDTIGNVLWFPLEELVEDTAGETLEFRLEQKSHKLLGGPFKSEWMK